MKLLMPAGVMVQISGAIKEQMEAFMDIAMLMLDKSYTGIS